MTNKVAIFSDLHMGVHCNSSMWFDISREWADWFANEMRNHSITDIIFCGDFFHDRDTIAVNAIQASYQVLDKLRDFKLHIFPGNHDCFYKQNPSINSLTILKGWSNITVYESPTQIKIGDNCTAMMCPWGTSLDDIIPSDVVFGHFEIQTFKMNTFKICEGGLSIRKLLEKSPLIFSGHFHFREERMFEIGQIIYCGNPFQTDMNDSNNAKGYYIFDSLSKSFSFYENTISPHIHRIKYSELSTKFDDILEIEILIKGNIVEFIFNEKISVEEVTSVKALINSFYPRSVRFIDETQVEEVIRKEADYKPVDVERAIIDFIDTMEYENAADLQEYAIYLYRKFKKKA